MRFSKLEHSTHKHEPTRTKPNDTVDEGNATVNIFEASQEALTSVGRKTNIASAHKRGTRNRNSRQRMNSVACRETVAGLARDDRGSKTGKHD